MKRLFPIVAIIAILYINKAVAQPVMPFTISFALPRYADKTIAIGYFYGNNTYLTDSVRLDPGGTKLYTGAYHEGLFLLILPDSAVFEFMVTNGKFYNISCDDSGGVISLKLKANPVAEAYVDYTNSIRRYNHSIDSLRTLINNTPDIQQKKNLKNSQAHKMNHRDSITSAYLHLQAETLPGNYIKAQQPVKIQAVRDINEERRNDSLEWMTTLNYYRDHYFDNISWNDPRLIYTPVIADKIDHYLENIVGKQPVLLLNAIDHILSLPENSEIRDFVLRHLFGKYKQINNKAINEYLFLHLLDTYIFMENISWLDDEEISRLKNEYVKRKPVSLYKKAPEISLPDKNNNIQPLYDISADYTIVFFWDYSCNTCRRVLTDLVKAVSKYNTQYVKVYTVFTGTDLDIWNAFLEKRIPKNWINTYQSGSMLYTDLFNITHAPTLLLLDKDKLILDKGLTVPEADSFLSRSLTDEKQ